MRRTRPCNTYTKQYRTGESGGATRTDARQMIVVGICEECAAKNDATLLREGFAEIRKAFPVCIQEIRDGAERAEAFPADA